MLLFDIGANRGDAVHAGLELGYRVVAVEAAPKIFSILEETFGSHPHVRALKLAVSDADFQKVTFYECIEDGLSTLNIDWLTADTMPYKGKQFWPVEATTITLDSMVKIYGEPDLIKIDVEGAEWNVFRGMSRKYGRITFEWTINTLEEHKKQLEYLAGLGYTKIGPQFIEHHLQEPEEWFDLASFSFENWLEVEGTKWTSEKWKKSHLRPTADVGMLWLD